MVAKILALHTKSSAVGLSDFFDFGTDFASRNKCPEANKVCVNYPGTYKCECQPGFELDFLYQRNCIEVDECKPNNGKGPCDHFCTNTEGSFRCECKDGYLLDENTKLRSRLRNQ